MWGIFGGYFGVTKRFFGGYTGDILGIHRRADSFVACTCFYIAEDVEYSEALFHWPG